MKVYTIENIEANIKQTVENAIVNHEPLVVQTDKGEAIIISKEDYCSYQYPYNEETVLAVKEANDDIKTRQSVEGYTSGAALLKALRSESQ